MGELLYEWNELEEADAHVLRGLERAELGGDIRTLIAGHVIRSRLKLSQGDVDIAATHLEQAQAFVEKASFPYWTNRFERCRLELWLAQGKLRTAVDWAEDMLQEEALANRPESEVSLLAMARVLIARGDAQSFERSLALLAQLLQKAETEGRMGVVIETLALQSIVCWKQGNHADAMTSLERALRLAAPEGYVRLFVDLGLPMARLLQEATSRSVLPGYVEALLAAFDSERLVSDQTGSPVQVPLPEPLTPREQEVLELIAAGLTNREIGETLVISPETVKKHTGNIYGKLGTSNRTEAVARAREFDLLS